MFKKQHSEQFRRLSCNDRNFKKINFADLESAKNIHLKLKLIDAFYDCTGSTIAQNADEYLILINGDYHVPIDLYQSNVPNSSVVLYSFLIDLNLIPNKEILTIGSVRASKFIYKISENTKILFLLHVESVENKNKTTISINHLKSININNWVRSKYVEID